MPSIVSFLTFLANYLTGNNKKTQPELSEFDFVHVDSLDINVSPNLKRGARRHRL